MENRPDLPVLERVEARYTASHSRSSAYSNRMYGGIVVFLSAYECLNHLIMDLMAHSSHGDKPSRVTIVLSLLTMAVFLIDHLFVRVHKWSTDENGLTAHKALWKIRVRWDHVKEVAPRTLCKGGSPCGYHLHTSDLSLWLPATSPMYRDYALLLASVRQHLRRIGKGDPVEAPDDIDDLWWDIPESVPDEISWTNPHPPDWRPLHYLIVLKCSAWVIVAILAILCLGWKAVAAPVILFSLLVIGMAVFLGLPVHANRTTVIRAHASAAGIEAETSYGIAFVKWSDIRSAAWAVNDVDLKLRGPRGTLRLPNHNNALTLLLVVLRNLREEPNHATISVPRQIRRCPQLSGDGSLAAIP